MQSNIFELIDLLVKMSGSKSNLDELKADLTDTEKEIEETQKKLDILEEEMDDDKYFDASSEIVDRNIKISLVKKIQKLNRIKSDVDQELEDIKSEELSLHNELEDLKIEINKANQYNDFINKMENPTEAYTNMIAVENNRITKLIDKKEELENKYDKVQKKVEYLAMSSSEMAERIAKEEERLNEIDENLANIKSYVDMDAKEEDEKKYLAIKEELEALINHKNDILENPVYIAGLIKEHIANENKDDVESEFNHLVSIVKEIPYMDLENEDIESEMSKLDAELKNYDTTISQKEYQTLDAEFIDERITYLEDYLKKLKERINNYENRIRIINEENDLLSAKIYRAESQIESIDSSLVDYENYDYDNNEIPKSVVQAANNKLVEERENIYNIAEKYRQDLIINIEDLERNENLHAKLTAEMSEKDAELDELNKKLSLNTKSKNVLEEEKDRIELEKINSKINHLKNREQFSKSISSILEEFEMLNSSLEFVDKKTRVQRRQHEIVEEPESTLEQPVIEEQPQVEEVPVAEENIPVIVENEQPIMPVVEEVVETPVDNKLRVVEVIPISDNIKEKEEEKDFMVNDFQDDDYVDFETVINNAEDK